MLECRGVKALKLKDLETGRSQIWKFVASKCESVKI